MYRDRTKVVKIGDRVIGGGNPILIQSMTNTPTEDADRTVKQILALEEEGCDIIRCTVPTEAAAKAIPAIKEKIHIPLVADIHFDYRCALMAIEYGADKIRINPGNIGSVERVKAVVDKAREHDIPIRVGVNSGSLQKDQIEKYGKLLAGRSAQNEQLESDATITLLIKNAIAFLPNINPVHFCWFLLNMDYNRGVIPYNPNEDKEDFNNLLREYNATVAKKKRKLDY